MKNSIAGKFALRVSVVLGAAFALLLAVAYVALERSVKNKVEQYSKAIVGIYGDLLVYDSTIRNTPIDLSFSENVDFFGSYICTWYRIDRIYAFVPDFVNDRITYLSLVCKKDGKPFVENVAGRTVPYKLSEGMLRAWNDSTLYAVEQSRSFRSGMDVMVRTTDRFGNMVLVGADVSSERINLDVSRGLGMVALMLFVIVALVAVFIYLLIRKTVSSPARKLSQSMSDYISGGKRTVVKLQAKGHDEFSMIADAFNKMTRDIDQYLGDIERMGREQERQRAEVDIASEIQRGILQPRYASLANCGIMAVMKPAKYIGGDLYDYLELDDTHTLAVVADVSGKGISSAMMMAITLTLVRQFAKMGCSPAQILRNVNDTMSEENPQMMFATAFVAIYDSSSCKLSYANAGHNPAYLLHDKVSILDRSEGTPLGLFPGEEYTDAVVDMEEGDCLFLYTDGVNEAVNADGEFYGTERLESVLAGMVGNRNMRLVEAVKESLMEFLGDAEQNDDITMLNLWARKRPVLELDYDVREFEKIKEYLFASRLSRDLIMDLCVAAEECFVNICSYAFDGPAPEGEKIGFYFEYSSKVVMRFTDGGRRFDPRCNLPETDEYDIDTSVGGLGRLIAFTIADSVDYEYRNGRNILTITKTVFSQ